LIATALRDPDGAVSGDKTMLKSLAYNSKMEIKN
jgi:hypothetical protein